MSSDEGASFKQKTVQAATQLFFKDSKTKINPEAAALLTRVLNIFASEAALRAAKEAKTDYAEEVTIDHFEKILPQLLGEDATEKSW